jgi:hypothetical protein
MCKSLSDWITVRAARATRFPLHRQEQIYQRHGVGLAVQIMKPRQLDKRYAIGIIAERK